jgi:uncharacterized protein (AIM24 family)
LYTPRNVLKKELAEGEILKVDTGCIVGFTKDVDYDIDLLAASRIPFWWRRFVLCHTSRSGTVYIQSLPFSRLADRISHLHQELGNSRDEGSLLGGLEVYSMETDDFKFNKRF